MPDEETAVPTEQAWFDLFNKIYVELKRIADAATKVTRGK